MWNDKVIIKLGASISVLAVIFLLISPPVGWLLAWLAYFIGILLVVFPQTFNAKNRPNHVVWTKYRNRVCYHLTPSIEMSLTYIYRFFSFNTGHSSGKNVRNL